MVWLYFQAVNQNLVLLFKPGWGGKCACEMFKPELQKAVASVTSATVRKISARSDLQSWFDVLLENWNTPCARGFHTFRFSHFQKCSTCFENCFAHKLKTPHTLLSCASHQSELLKKEERKKKSKVRYSQRGKGQTFHFCSGCDPEITHLE